MVQSFAPSALISLLWVIVGYSLTFGADHGGVIGGFQRLLIGVSGHPSATPRPFRRCCTWHFR